jgi:hypothetical protein
MTIRLVIIVSAEVVTKSWRTPTREFLLRLARFRLPRPLNETANLAAGVARSPG